MVFVFEGPGIERTCSRPRQRPDPLGRVQCLGTASRRDARARTRRVPLENRPATVRQARRPTRVNGPRQDPATVEARAFSRKTTKPGFARGPLGVHEAVISGHRESPSVRGFGGTERPGVTDDGMARQPPITRNEGVPGSSPGVGFRRFAGEKRLARSLCGRPSGTHPCKCGFQRPDACARSRRAPSSPPAMGSGHIGASSKGASIA